MKDQELKMALKKGYSRVARSGSSCCQSDCCGSAKPQQISRKIGYTDEQMEAVPEGSNLGLGCGNPVAMAGLKEVRRCWTWDLGLALTASWPPWQWVKKVRS